MTDLKSLRDESLREIRAAKGKALDILKDSLAKRGIAPTGWSKMTAQEKRDWLEANLPPVPEVPAVVVKKKEATMPKDPKWTRRPKGLKRWMIPLLAARAH